MDNINIHSDRLSEQYNFDPTKQKHILHNNTKIILNDKGRPTGFLDNKGKLINFVFTGGKKHISIKKAKVLVDDYLENKNIKDQVNIIIPGKRAKLKGVFKSAKKGVASKILHKSKKNETKGDLKYIMGDNPYMSDDEYLSAKRALATENPSYSEDAEIDEVLEGLSDSDSDSDNNEEYNMSDIDGALEVSSDDDSGHGGSEEEIYAVPNKSGPKIFSGFQEDVELPHDAPPLPPKSYTPILPRRRHVSSDRSNLSAPPLPPKPKSYIETENTPPALPPRIRSGSSDRSALLAPPLPPKPHMKSGSMQPRLPRRPASLDRSGLPVAPMPPKSSIEQEDAGLQAPPRTKRPIGKPMLISSTVDTENMTQIKQKLARRRAPLGSKPIIPNRNELSDNVQIQPPAFARPFGQPSTKVLPPKLPKPHLTPELKRRINRERAKSLENLFDNS